MTTIQRLTHYGSNNILLITHVNFSKGFRGGERQTQLLIEQLSKFGYKQRLLLRKNSELNSRCKHISNLEIFEIPKPYIFHLSLVKQSTLIHAHETKALQFAYAAKIFLNIPFIVTRRVAIKIKTNWLNTKMYTSAFKAVALSRAIKTEILRVSPKAKVDVIPSAYSDISINIEAAKLIKKRFSQKFLIGHVGALNDADKGQSFLIEAAKKLALTHPDIHFILLGRGVDEQTFKEQAKGLENITFEGFVNNVNDYIACFDLFVFPSRHEGLGSILFDVMQLKVPIIATDVGGIPDIISNKENGILIPSCDAQAIKQAILELYDDKKKGELLAKNALVNIHYFAPSEMAKRYMKIYKEA